VFFYLISMSIAKIQIKFELYLYAGLLVACRIVDVNMHIFTRDVKQFINF